MKEIKRCYLTAVISEDGKKVEQVCVNRDEYPLPPLPSKDARSILKQQRSRWMTMACNLHDTVIYNSVKRSKKLEQFLLWRKEIERLRIQEKEQEKVERWINKRKE